MTDLEHPAGGRRGTIAKGKSMSVRAKALVLAGRFRAWSTRLVADRRGVAAIEFAFIAPLLLSMYFVTMEVSQGIENSKKVSRIGSMVADLITQQQTISQCEVNAIMAIGESILQPYSRSKSTIVVTGITMTDDPSPRALVAWSRKLAEGAISVDEVKDTPTTVPTQLMARNSFLIRVKSDLPYRPVITWAAGQQSTLGLGVMGKIFKNGVFQMSETYYLRPRMSVAIPCADCATPNVKCL